MASTRERIVSEALRLFGAQGFARTSVAQIEAAAGLSRGSGALYRHFASKDELLVEAVRSRLVDRGEWQHFLDPDFSIAQFLAAVAPSASTADRLWMLCRIGLMRLEHDRDVTRILLRDNSIAPEVLEVFRREEFVVVTSVVARGLTELAGPKHADVDWEATAAVIVGAIAHYWLMCDIFGGDHPSGMDSERYLRATADLMAAQIDAAAPLPLGELETLR
ncbi:TetR/AcrR family transcriptional regulator [Nocardia cyriacigeorgica]|uniref:TetR/AcrR family transcriptional regulator n=1 Tax=Nocardia cyriacigeorgica TaxID=135487 RepID=UPI0013D48138|nr:TetR/AcrR family transcriptional regulator [Nocardia cyriacigeorgica]MBF6437761.1 TetR/AcrR family transcriptional regulator [Nocardia cyriacigeorgica]NEW27351.1 TetR/AcrR family transcriptional regulator [Nocardia cyriacigeorgica]